jgi:excisionase family DNA binding protein
MTASSTSFHGTPDAYLTTRQLAERLQVSTNTVCRLAREGRIPCHRVGHRTLRFVAAEVDAALRADGPTGSDFTGDLDAVVEQVVGDVFRQGGKARL